MSFSYFVCRLAPGMRVCQDTLPSIIKKRRSTTCLKGKIFGITTRMASGFFVARDLVVTNVHAIKGMTKVSICAGDHSLPKSYPLVGVTAFDTRNDLVVLKVSEAGVPLPIGKTDALKKGEPVYFIGYGHNGEYNGIMGVVIDPHCSRLFQIKVKRPKDNVGPGYSGGAVLNSSGEVVGVIVSACENENSEKSYIFVNAIPTIVLRALISNAGQVESWLTWQKRPEIRAYTKIALGYAKSEKGKYKKAKSYYDCAIKLNAEYFYAFFNRGNVNVILAIFAPLCRITIQHCVSILNLS